MGEWKEYMVFCFGEQVRCETARSKKEAVDLYVEECIERYKEEFGIEPTDDMIEDAYKNTEVVGLSD